MANQTATDYGVYPPRAVHIGVNRMHTNIITTISSSASDNLYMFQIPPDCFVVNGGIKASVPRGHHGQYRPAGWHSRQPHGVRHLHPVGYRGLATKFTSMISPVTVSSSGTDAPTPVVISVNCRPRPPPRSASICCSNTSCRASSTKPGSTAILGRGSLRPLFQS
jgi:hypothetical protein